MKKLVAALLVMTGCGFQGTGTGNPISHLGSEGANSGLAVVMDRMCRKIQSCHPEADTSQCWNYILPMTEFSGNLGASETPLTTLQSLIVADGSGSRPADEGGLADCGQSVEEWTCAAPEVQGAFDAQAENPFAGAAALIRPADCARVFGP